MFIPDARPSIGRRLKAGRTTRRRNGRAVILAAVVMAVLTAGRAARDAGGDRYSPPAETTGAPRPTLRLMIRAAADEDTAPAAAAARFSLIVDGKPFFPKGLGPHGLRFVSVHESKKQVYVVTYARGSGPVEIELPAGSREVEVHAARGFEYLPAATKKRVGGEEVRVELVLRRWTDLAAKGWAAADEHVHYDRLDRRDDRDWLAMLAGDGLDHAHFLVLKGGKVPGVWAKQYAYGQEGEARDGRRFIRSGEEYRDSFQGHVNLLGIDRMIQPISTGGLGRPSVPFHYPPLRDVMLQARRLGGLSGVAHGGSLGRRPTAILDTVLGAVDFFEIANAHLYSFELWYRLLRCGYVLPPAAGTDLPNYPFRDPWQPFLGSMRMYVKMDGGGDFASWKRALQRGEVFVTSGPIPSFRVNGSEPGGTIRLPAGGGEVTVEAELASAVGLTALEIVQNGRVLPATVRKHLSDGVHRWRLRRTVRIKESCWLAARGRGVPIQSLAEAVRGTEAPWIETRAIAHTAPVRVIVGGRPIRSSQDAMNLIEELRTQQEFYRTRARYREGRHRLKVLELFDRAVAELEKRR